MENAFLVGLDLGHKHTSIMIKEIASGKTSLLDRTGGYGSLYVPTCIYYDQEAHAYLVGEEAFYHHEDESCYVRDLLEGLKTQKYHTVIGISYKELLRNYVEILMRYLIEMNPYAVIERVVIGLPFLEAWLQEDFSLSFGSQVIEPLWLSRQTGLTNYLNEYKKETLSQLGDIILMDYGHQTFSVYGSKAIDHYRPYEIMSIPSLAGKEFESNFLRALCDLYLDLSGQEVLGTYSRHQVEAMVVYYTPYLLKRYEEGKALKVTFQFAFPPFIGILSEDQVKGLIDPLREDMASLMVRLQTYLDQGQAVFLLGNGFRMAWAKALVHNMAKGLVIDDPDGLVKGLLGPIEPMASHSNPEVLKEDVGLLIMAGQEEAVFIKLGRKGQAFSDQFESLALVVDPIDQKDLVLYAQGAEGLEVLEAYPLCQEEDQDIIRVQVSLCIQGHKPALQIDYVSI